LSFVEISLLSSPPGIGDKTMRTWLTAIAALVLGVGAAQAQDCALKQFDSLPLEVYPDHLLLPVSLAKTPEKLVFRMGDAASGLNADTAAKLDLYITSMPTHLTFHRDGEEITRVAHGDLQLGRQNIKGMEFLVLRPGRYGGEVVGDLGTRVLGNVDWELDIAGAKLNLFSQDHCPGKTVYWTKTGFAQVALKSSKDVGYIRAEVMLDGHPITVALSTEGRSRIGMNAMRRIFNIDENSPELVAVDQDLLGHRLYRYPFKALTADSLTINNPAILVYDEEPRPECNDKLHYKFPDPPPLHSTEQPRLARCFGGDDAVLGLSVLSKLHLYVSIKENMLYLTGATAK
jgi:hypothetical protein